MLNQQTNQSNYHVCSKFAACALRTSPRSLHGEASRVVVHPTNTQLGATHCQGSEWRTKRAASLHVVSSVRVKIAKRGSLLHSDNIAWFGIEQDAGPIRHIPDTPSHGTLVWLRCTVTVMGAGGWNSSGTS